MPRKIERGSIWLANLNPGGGTEPGKTRPVLVVQHQALLDVEHPSTLIIPLTTRLTRHAEPLRIRVPSRELLERDSDLLIDQIRAIDNRRLTQGPLAHVDKGLMDLVAEALKEVLGIEPG
ncbi:MAG: type II toxin-antitoxin system PemK/MazF family toxin [Candidatus Geothermincolia bacterium]